MTFVQIEKRSGMVNLDGYSRNKTLKGALKDLAREVAKIDEGEAHCIADYLDETVQMALEGMPNEADAYYIEAEEVPCASRYKYNKGDEDDFDIEYAEGHWYLFIRFVDSTALEVDEAETSTAEQMDETETIESVDAETVNADGEGTQGKEAMKYESKRTEAAPFDIMCSNAQFMRSSGFETSRLRISAMFMLRSWRWAKLCQSGRKRQSRASPTGFLTNANSRNGPPVRRREPPHPA